MGLKQPNCRLSAATDTSTPSSAPLNRQLTVVSLQFILLSNGRSRSSQRNQIVGIAEKAKPVTLTVVTNRLSFGDEVA
jgi:hypothetical protein